MPGLTDVMPAMESFQDALSQGLPVEAGMVDPSLFYHFNMEAEHPRFVYVRLDDTTVKAYVCFTPYTKRNGLTIFGVGYAVPDAYRGQGLAKNVFAAGLAELRNGLGLAGRSPFYVQAIIDPKNQASQHVAASVLRVEPTSITDGESGLPAIEYIRKFETGR